MVRKVVDSIVREGKFVFRFHLHEIDVSEIRDIKSCVIMNKKFEYFFNKMENLGSECGLLS